MGTTTKTKNNVMLRDEHRQHLKQSGLTDNSIEEYGFVSIAAEATFGILGRKLDSDGLAIPYPGIEYCRIRPDTPRLTDDGKPIKYESPTKSKFPDGNALFITHLAEDIIKDTTIPLYFTEGEKKSICLEQIGLPAISISGVYSWLTTDDKDVHRKPIKMLTELPLKRREVYIIFDSDKFENEQVMKAERDFASCLSSSFGAKVKIVNLDKEFGKGADDQILKLGKEDFKETYIKKAVDFDPDNPTECQTIEVIEKECSFRAISCNELKAMDIPPVKFIVEDMIEKGLCMIDGDSETCKTNTALVLAILMAMGGSIFLDRFKVMPARVLYVDLEMGISALKQKIRLLLAGMGIEEWPKDLHVISPGTDEGFEFDLKNIKTQKNIEREIEKIDPDIMFLDTLFDSSSYDLLSHKDSLELKKYLKKIRSRYDLPVVLIHHRRKPSGDRLPSSGKHEIYGSVVIPAACDRIVSLAGTADEITVRCSKARNGVKFSSFIMKLCADKPKDASKLWFEYVAEYKERGSKEKTDDQVVAVFESFGKDKVSRQELEVRSKELNCYAWDTLKTRLLATKRYTAIKEGKEVYIVRCVEAEVVDNENG